MGGCEMTMLQTDFKLAYILPHDGIRNMYNGSKECNLEVIYFQAQNFRVESEEPAMNLHKIPK